MEKVCLFCGKQFATYHSTQRYCSPSCSSRDRHLLSGHKLRPDKPKPKPERERMRERMRERLAERDAAYAAWQSENGVADRSTVYAGVQVVNRGTVPVAARTSWSELRIARV